MNNEGSPAIMNKPLDKYINLCKIVNNWFSQVTFKQVLQHLLLNKSRINSTVFIQPDFAQRQTCIPCVRSRFVANVHNKSIELSS